MTVPLLVGGADVWVGCYRSDISTGFKILGENVDGVPAAGGENLEIVSASVNDAVAGTGAQKIVVIYLDDSGVLQSEEISTNGTTAVQAASSDYWRVLGFHVSQVGSGNQNAGKVTLRKASAGGDYGDILGGYNTFLPGQFTIPDGKTARILGGFFMCPNPASNYINVSIEAEVDPLDGSLTADTFHTLATLAFTSSAELPALDPTRSNVDTMLLPSLCTVRARAKASAIGTHVVTGALRLEVT